VTAAVARAVAAALALRAAGPAPRPSEGEARAGAEAAARSLLAAAGRGDAAAILALVADEGLRCMEATASRAEVQERLASPGDGLRAAFLDTARLRELHPLAPPAVSLSELFRRGGPRTLEVVFWDRVGEGPWDRPCVEVHAARYRYAPVLCFVRRKGRFRLWRSPEPGC